MKSKFIILIFCLILFVSCNSNFIDSRFTSTFLGSDNDSIEYVEDETLNGKYITNYTIYWDTGIAETKTIYSDKEIYTCAFQGTNFLLEKDNKEEILSTTAPIQIIKSEIVK